MKLKHIINHMAFLGLLIFPCTVQSQINSAKVFWVGHSLVDGKNWSDPQSLNLLDQMEALSTAAGKSYAHHRHTIPGAPLGWNWGVAASWESVRPQIAPLTDEQNAQYGTFDAIVITEGVNINSSYDSWASGFYARKFFAAAKRANPSARLFLYESWHHFNAGDFATYYGPQESFDWRAYMISARTTWEKIADESADPAVLALSPDPWNNRENYVFQGQGEDPGVSNEVLTVHIVPTGQVLVRVLDRIAENRPGDNWTFSDAAKGGRLSGVDFFMNPLLNFPEDLSTTVHGGEMDDIHSSEVLSYLNGLTHFAVLYKQTPVGLPASPHVPQHIATLFQQIVWEVVTSDSRTGVSGTGTVRLKNLISNPEKKGGFGNNFDLLGRTRTSL